MIEKLDIGQPGHWTPGHLDIGLPGLPGLIGRLDRLDGPFRPIGPSDTIA